MLALTLIAILFASAHADDAPSVLRRVSFAYEPGAKTHERVFLAGTFNGWRSDATEMRWTGELWKATVPLAPGEYQYKFVADGAWITDDKAERFHPDGFGGQNSVLVVDSSFDRMVMARGDGQILAEGLSHRQNAWELSRRSTGPLTVRTRAWRGDIEAAFLVADGVETEMQRFDTDGSYDYYTADVSSNEQFSYRFRIVDGNKELWLGPGGAGASPEQSGAYVYDPDAVPPFSTPDWVKHGIFYQIFPERFANGDRDNDPDFSEPYYDGKTTLPESGKTNDEYFHLVEDWYDVSGLSESPYRTDGRPDWYSFYGGDIEGVRQKLDYLVDLGVNIIYFNPVVESKSSHKYDAASYMRVDPHFASSREFASFVGECHERGIRVIVDTAFNHTGETFWAFEDTREKGAESDYWYWYEWRNWPLPVGETSGGSEYYDCWWGFGQMPNINFDLSMANEDEHGVADISAADPNWPVVEHILAAATYWLTEMGVDGFRLDVANEVPLWFWELFRERVKRVKPDAYIVGELWGASPEYVNGRYFDAVMNYKFFRDPVLAFIARGDTEAAEFDRALAPGRLIYPEEGALAMMNLVGSHDTERILRLCGGDARRVELATLFAVTYVGAPHIYYGDEIAMDGGRDPDCRRPFAWNWEDDDSRVAAHDRTRALLRLRHEREALVSGSFETLVAEGRTFAYRRGLDGADVIVAMNAGDNDEELSIPADAITLEVALPPLSWAVFLRDAATGEWARWTY